ncbi:MAG: MurR/RpiR family transcriptional regulator [Clostridium sp.]|uniref:MurR/RpiR family transcriptional regulator n=1 Tax=Clostridium sp. TaxID=1506 RepID=UPI003F40DE2F
MKVIEVIKVKYDKFTNSEKRIGDYILKNYREFIELSSKEIGEKTDTSGATVVRFCKKIELDGLDKLKIELAKEIENESEIEEIDPILHEDDSVKDIVKKVYSNVDIALKRTLELIDIDNLEKILKEIRRAENIYIYAIGASSLSAYDLYHKFNRVNKRCFFNFDANMNLEFSAHTNQNDIAIAISYSGQSKEVNLAVENVKKNNTKVISIVKEGDSKLKSLSDYTLNIPNNEKRIRVGAVSSKFSQMFYADLLYLGSIKTDLDLIFNYLKETNIATNDLKE